MEDVGWLPQRGTALAAMLVSEADCLSFQLYLYGHPHHLRPLQGLCVPSIIGVYSTPEGLANMAMEPPHPHAWRVADRSISTAEKGAIVEAYIQIHARGVLHGDVALKHMLIGMLRLTIITVSFEFDAGRDGKPTIINFRHASCLQPAMEIGLGGCHAHEFQLEMRQVRFLLDYQGAREFEYRLARENRSAIRMNTHKGDTFTAPVCIVHDRTTIVDANLCASASHI